MNPRPRILPRLLGAVVLAGLVLGAPALTSAASSQGAEDAACGTGTPTGGNTPPERLRDAALAVSQATDELFVLIEARSEFTPGWMNEPEVAGAVAAIRDGADDVQAAAGVILRSRGWTFEDGPQPHPDDVPVSPGLALLANEVWNAPDAVDGPLMELSNLTDKDAIIEFWTVGGSPCGAAASLRGFVAQASTVSSGALAATGGAPWALLVVAAGSIVGGFVLLAAAQSANHIRT